MISVVFWINLALLLEPDTTAPSPLWTITKFPERSGPLFPFTIPLKRSTAWWRPSRGLFKCYNKSLILNMETIQEVQEEIVEEFSMFEDWMQRYEYMIELGKSLPMINIQYKTDDYIIKGCQSKVWIHADLHDDKLIFTADSDAIITKGIIAILIRAFSHQHPDAILEAGTEFIDKIGLKEHLSPTRANGLVSMIKQLKMYAIAFKTQLN